MFPASFGYVAAHSVEEALQLLAQHGEDAKLLAGGHSLIPAMKLRLASPRTLIDLGTVPDLSGVRVDGNVAGHRRFDGALRRCSLGSGAQTPARASRGGVHDRRRPGAQSRHHRR